PGRRSFFVQLRLNLPSASHNPVGFGRYVCISRRSVVHNLAIPPDPHVVLWGSGGMVEGMSTVITVLNPKGGVSKTVTFIFVATALARQGSVTVEVADPQAAATRAHACPQASATEWSFTAQDAGEPLPFDVVPGSAATIRRALPRHDFVIIDTPPGVAEVLDAATEAADIVLIPTMQSSLELTRAWAALDAIDNTAAALFLARAETGSTTFGLSRAALQEAAGGSVYALETFIPKREAIRQVAGVSCPTALHGYDALADEVLAILERQQ